MKHKFYTALTLLFFTCLHLATSAQSGNPEWKDPGMVNATGVCFMTPLIGIAASTGDSQMTTDGGNTWNTMPGISAVLNKALAPSEQHVIGFVNTNIWVSFDGGNSFVSAAGPGATEITSLFFLDDNHGWAGDNEGYLQVSIDGGSTWHTVIASALGGNSCTALAFSTTNNGVVGTNAGTLFYTTTGAGDYTFTASTIPS